MNTALLLAAFAGFGGGLAFALISARRRLRDRLNDAVAREVEKRIARRLVDELAGRRTPGESPKAD